MLTKRNEHVAVYKEGHCVMQVDIDTDIKYKSHLVTLNSMNHSLSNMNHTSVHMKTVLLKLNIKQSALRNPKLKHQKSYMLLHQSVKQNYTWLP